MIAIVILVGNAPTPEELEALVRSAESRMMALEQPRDQIPTEHLIPQMASLLRDIELIRRQSVAMRKGIFYSRWEDLENRWIQYLDTIHLTSRREMYRLISLAEINRETWDRISRKVPELPPRPEAISAFRESSSEALRLPIRDLQSESARREILEIHPSYVWISIPSIDFLDSEGNQTAEEHFLYGFERKATIPNFADLGEIEVWDVRLDSISILFRATPDHLIEVYRQKPKSILEWKNRAQYEARLDHFSPGSQVIEDAGTFRAARWDRPFSLDELIDLDAELPPSVWLAFRRGPRFHFEPLNVLDRMPSLGERGGFSILERSKGPPLVYLTDPEFRSLHRELPHFPPPRVVDLLNIAFSTYPTRFPDCGAFLRRFGLLKPPA